MLYFSINPKSFGQLGIWKHQLEKCPDKVFQIKCDFLRPYCVVFLDQLLLNIPDQKPKNLNSTYPRVNQYLKQCGFKSLEPHAKCREDFPQKEIIQLRRFRGSLNTVEGKVVSWLKKDVLTYMPELSRKLKKDIVENLWEIVNNGIRHGECEHGVSACGQFYPQMGYFEVAFCDGGHGIPKVVKDYKAKKATASDLECITWAIQEGNSTRPLGESAGLGLHLLRQFLRLNGGTFQIASGVGYYADDNNSNSTPSLKNSVDGTIVNIRVIYDDNIYRLKGE